MSPQISLPTNPLAVPAREQSHVLWRGGRLLGLCAADIGGTGQVHPGPWRGMCVVEDSRSITELQVPQGHHQAGRGQEVGRTHSECMQARPSQSKTGGCMHHVRCMAPGGMGCAPLGSVICSSCSNRLISVRSWFCVCGRSDGVCRMLHVDAPAASERCRRGVVVADTCAATPAPCNRSGSHTQCVHGTYRAKSARRR